MLSKTNQKSNMANYHGSLPKFQDRISIPFWNLKWKEINQKNTRPPIKLIKRTLKTLKSMNLSFTLGFLSSCKQIKNATRLADFTWIFKRRKRNAFASLLFLWKDADDDGSVSLSRQCMGLAEVSVWWGTKSAVAKQADPRLAVFGTIAAHEGWRLWLGACYCSFPPLSSVCTESG